MLRTQALYTCILVFTVRLLLSRTLVWNFDMTAKAFAILELICGSRESERFELMLDPRYWDDV